MDAEEASLEDGAIVFEVDGDAAAHADLFPAIDDDVLRRGWGRLRGREVALEEVPGFTSAVDGRRGRREARRGRSVR